MSVRIPVVERLYAAALKGLEDEIRTDPVADGAEVLSAMLAMAMTAVTVATELDADLESFRSPLEKMYALLPPRIERTH